MVRCRLMRVFPPVHKLKKASRMNKIYSVVWNSALGIWTVASELTRGKKKSNSRKTLAALTAMTSGICDHYHYGYT